MADDGLNEKQVILGFELRNTIFEFTKRTPMTAEDVIKALCFVAGSACGQKEAHSVHSTKQLRNMAVTTIDKGIDSARGDNRPKLINLN